MLFYRISHRKFINFLNSSTSKTVFYISHFAFNSKRLLALFLFFLAVYYASFNSAAFAASVTISWNGNTEVDIAGYRLYYGTSSENYDFMIDFGNQTTGTINDLEPDNTYYIAATAYNTQDNESGFSAEVSYTVPSLDTDGDGVIDDVDAFPMDPNESVDTDGDGVGNNADEDDDNDGMPDDWEITYSLNPLINDASEDPDGDGVSNIDEYLASTDPNFNDNNSAPDPPVLYLPIDYDQVATDAVLKTNGFYDPNVGDFHAESHWQIIRAGDNIAVFEKISTISLTSLSIPKLVLDDVTDYIWQVKFVDNHGTASDWSETGHFTTEPSEWDSDGNGIPDLQEVDSVTDLDEDGTPDNEQNDIKCVNVEGGSAQIGISIRDAEGVESIVSIESENPDDLYTNSDSSDSPAELPFGLINFKLIVTNPGDEVVVTLFLSEAAPVGAIWYKYDPVDGIWQDYSEYTGFSSDRKSVYLTLIDGGFSDADGLENGIIVDPLALGMPSSSTSSVSEDGAGSSSGSGSGSGGSACFITSIAAGLETDQPMKDWLKIRGYRYATILLLPFLYYMVKKKRLFVKSIQKLPL